MMSPTFVYRFNTPDFTRRGVPADFPGSLVILRHNRLQSPNIHKYITSINEQHAYIDFPECTMFYVFDVIRGPVPSLGPVPRSDVWDYLMLGTDGRQYIMSSAKKIVTDNERCDWTASWYLWREGCSK